MPTRIFISHASDDVEIAAALTDCILASMAISDDEVRCTSVPGHKLPVGSDFSHVLREDIDSASVVIGLITKKSLRSSWVLFELGATWGANKNLKPIMSSDVDAQTLPGPLGRYHIARLSESDDLEQFLAEVATTVGAKPRSVSKAKPAVAALQRAHDQYVLRLGDAARQPRSGVDDEDLAIAGVPIWELAEMLAHEPIQIPPEFANGTADTKSNLCDLFVMNAHVLTRGVVSTWEQETAGGWLYREVAARLLPFGLVEYESLHPKVEGHLKRITVSADGHRFLRVYKRAASSLRRRGEA